MKVILFMAISLNGMIARENGDEDWLPLEGWKEFLILAKKYNNFIIGRETYEVLERINNSDGTSFDDVEAEHKIIVSRNPDYVAPGYGIMHSPEEALNFLKNKECKTAVLTGGGKLNSQFFRRNLVNEIWFVINPHILGRGRAVVAPEDLDLPLQLLSVESLSKDRVLLKYEVK